MFCPKCGTRFSDQENFCPNCGAPVTGRAGGAASAPGPRKNKPKAFLAAIAAAAVLIAVVVGVYELAKSGVPGGEDVAGIQTDVLPGETLADATPEPEAEPTPDPEAPDSEKQEIDPIPSPTDVHTESPAPATTDSPVDTFAESAEVFDASQAAKVPNGLPSVAEVTAETIVEGDGYTAYDFCTEGWAGCGMDGSQHEVEMYYGIHAETDGSKLYYRAYSHLDDVEPVAATITRKGNGTVRTIPIKTEDTRIGMQNQQNDLFVITVKFSNDETCSIGVYVNDKTAWVVNYTSLSAERVQDGVFGGRNDLAEIIKEWNVTPENTIGVTTKDIAYPTYDGRGAKYRCDTELWKALAHEIVADDSLNDTVKLTLVHDWMTANLAYDHYKVNVLKNNRSNYYKDWSGAQNMYDTHAGKCVDFVNALAIMARELGIPCTTIENKGHTWNIVYVDGKWMEIDITSDINRNVFKEDVTDITNEDDIYDYDGFMCTSSHSRMTTVDSLGQCIYTDTLVRTGHQ